MMPFEYARAKSVDSALELASQNPRAAFLAGGTTLIDLMKEGVERPTVLIDIRRLATLDYIDVEPRQIRLGALAKNSDIAAHPELRAAAPMLSQAIEAGASPQLRNMATIGGNLLQRTRCAYFRNRDFACNKRKPGSGCAAMNGYDRAHAVLGTSDSCIATHPSDLAVAVVALGGQALVAAAADEHAIAFDHFFRSPDETPWIETNLGHGMLIVGVVIDLPAAARRSVYIKVRDRASYEFALSSAAVGLHQHGKRVLDARIALGGVATRPWRCKAAEAAIIGQDAGLRTFREAAEIALAGATSGRENAFKIELAKRTLIRALIQASELPA